MVRRNSSEAGRQLCSAQRGQLVRMHFELKAKIKSSFQNAIRFGNAEHSRFTKNIAELSQLLLGDLRQHLAHQKIDIARLIVAKLRRHRMGAEKRRDQL